MKKFPLLSFDIEIANIFTLEPGQSFDDYAPFDITVAATGFSSGDCKPWYSVDAKGTPTACMEHAQAEELLEYLASVQDEGVRVAAWNGVSFDLQWIGHAAKNMELAGRVALRSYDPMLQFLWARGFPVKLAKVGQAMGIKQEKLMDGADAPIRWKDGDHQSVIDYVIGDVQITNQIIDAIETKGCIRWVTTRGTESSEPIDQLLPAREVLMQTRPDQSWMDSPIDLDEFYSWIPSAVLAEADVPH